MRGTRSLLPSYKHRNLGDLCIYGINGLNKDGLMGMHLRDQILEPLMILVSLLTQLRLAGIQVSSTSFAQNQKTGDIILPISRYGGSLCAELLQLIL